MQESDADILNEFSAYRQAGAGKIKLEFNAVHSNHLRVTKKDQGLVSKCRAALTLSVQKVRLLLFLSNVFLLSGFAKYVFVVEVTTFHRYQQA